MLVQSDTATACFRVKRTQDVDIHARNLASWEQHYEQTSPGAFSGEVHELVDHGLQVFEEVATCATSQRCRPWPGGVWVGLAVPEADQGLRFMGRPSHGLQLMLAGGEEPFDLQVPAGHGLYGMVLDKEQLARHVQALHQQPWPEHWAGAPRVQALTALQRYRLAGMVREVLRCLQEQPEALHHEASRRSLREALLSVLCDVVMPQTLSEAVNPRQLRRQELVRKVRELVFEHPEQPLSVSELCTRLHVTRRTLQNGFQETLGTSPATYLRTVRLNAVRRALREKPSRSSTIADTAARWGFWHMGHFSQDYKALFGETPSRTRQLA
ncbi:helix-turn-helix domain-containing protein [Hydrogenophaga sp.]|uniref:helix-turn-helix domain-containing protein n=1 Tax=Hydrogenophaga sp. TaxID=1904254 RepID=UPI00261F0E00|nr:helix-turn-helix domain-containing protein [Hydrogenophaga sp.]